MTIQELLVYWEVIRKRLWLIGTLTLTTIVVILLVSYLSPPVYQATASFEVYAALPAEVTLFSEYKTSSSDEQLSRTKDSFIAVLRSEFAIRQTIEDLNLDMTVDEFVAQMLVEPDEFSNFVHLRVGAPEPELAAAIANTLLDKSSLYFAELSAGSITASKEFIQLQMEAIREELDEARTALVQFQIENRMDTSGGVLGMQENLITSLKQNRDKAFAEGNQTVVVGYDEIIAERERELQELILLSSQYNVLQGNLDRIANIYSVLESREIEATLKENEILSARFIQVVPALEPTSPLPRLNVNVLLLGVVVSLALGIMIAFALEYLSRTVVEDSVDTPSSLPQAHWDLEATSGTQP